MTNPITSPALTRRRLLANSAAATGGLMLSTLLGGIPRAFAQEGSVLRIATAQEPGGWGLLNGGGGSEGQNVINLLYDTLITYDEQLNVGEKLATKWERISDLEWRFTLREGLSFTNGEPVDAAAVAHSIEHIATVEPAYTYRNQWLASWPPTARVEDALNVVISTPVPQPILPRLLSRVAITPPLASADPSFVERPVGSGPYKLVSWTPGIELSFEANEDYWGGAPAIKRIEWTIIPDPSTRVLALQSGDVDLVWDVPYERIADVNADERLKVLEFDSIGLAFLTFNFRSTSAVTDPRVRRAMTYAIDRVGIRDALMSGKGVLNTGPAPDGVIGAVDAGGFPERDVEMAKSLLAEAGHPDGLDLVMIYTPGQFQQDMNVCGAIIAMLEEANVRVKFEEIPSGAMNERRQQTDWDIYPNGVPGSFTGEAGYHYNQLKDRSGFYDEATENLLNQASVTEGEERVALIQDAMRAMWEQTPYLWSVATVRNFGTLRSLEGYRYIPVNWLLLSQAHL